MENCIDHIVTLTQIYRREDTSNITLLFIRLTEAHVLITIAQNSSTY